jgi:hypothetical protein
MGLKESYLVLYNVVQALGWAAILGLSTNEIVQTGRTDTVYASAGVLVCEPRLRLPPVSLHLLSLYFRSRC